MRYCSFPITAAGSDDRRVERRRRRESNSGSVNGEFEDRAECDEDVVADAEEEEEDVLDDGVYTERKERICTFADLTSGMF